MWSIVATSFAARTGWIVGRWTVANTPIRSVAAASPAAHVSVSKLRWLKLVLPPMPFHRATGMIASMPACSAARAMATDSSHSTLIVLGMSVIEAPPLTFTANTPSLRRLLLDRTGLVDAR